MQTANYFGKLTDRLKELAAANDKNIVEEPIKEEPEAEQKLHNGTLFSTFLPIYLKFSIFNSFNSFSLVQ